MPKRGQGQRLLQLQIQVILLSFSFILKCSLNTTEKTQILVGVWFLNFCCFCAGPGYPASNPEMGFGGITYPPDSYSMHQVCSHCVTHKVLFISYMHVWMHGGDTQN